MTPANVLSDAVQLAKHEVRIETLEGWLKAVEKKLDRVQWLLVMTLAAAVMNLFTKHS